jgi:hypothetical protein
VVCLRQIRNSNRLNHVHLPPAWHRKCRATFRHEAVTRAHLPPSFPGGLFVRRADLLKPDAMSEVILLGAGASVLAIVILGRHYCSDSCLLKMTNWLQFASLRLFLEKYCFYLIVS